jgi:hypothetical protein
VGVAVLRSDRRQRLVQKAAKQATGEAEPTFDWAPQFAVRREWPDGTHDFAGMRRTVQAANGFARRDRNFWRAGPLRPLWFGLVVMSRRDFVLHGKQRRHCTAPDCPVPDADAVLPGWSR